MTEWLPQALYILGGILVIVFIWAGIELALTLNRTRKTISDLDPTIEKLNSMSATLEPASKRIDPLIERVSLTVDAVNLEIMRADQILSDVSDVTGSLSGTVSKVTDLTDAPLNLLTSAAEKVRDVLGGRKATKAALSSPSKPDVEADVADQSVAEDTAADVEAAATTKARVERELAGDASDARKAEAKAASVRRISDNGYFNYPQTTSPTTPEVNPAPGAPEVVVEDPLGRKADPVDFSPDVS